MCLTDLYVKLLNHNIAHVTYDAEIAGLRFAYFQSLCVTYSYISEQTSTGHWCACMSNCNTDVNTIYTAEFNVNVTQSAVKCMFVLYVITYNTNIHLTADWVLTRAVPNTGLELFGRIRIVTPTIHPNTNTNSSTPKQFKTFHHATCT